MLFNILSLISTLVFLTVLKRLVNILSPLTLCLVRWKECVNLESSVKNSYDRNLIAVVLVVPFCLIAEKFNLYSPSFLAGMSEGARLGIIFGVFVAYNIIRLTASVMIRGYKSKKKVFDMANSCAYSFFIILTIVLFACGGIMSFCDVDPNIIKSTMLYVSAFFYIFYLIRKTQILISGFSFLTSFLYLCALEIVPTGILVVSALVF